MYKLTGKTIDMELYFETKAEAEEKMQEWVNDDLQEFGEDTSNDYYIEIG